MLAAVPGLPWALLMGEPENMEAHSMALRKDCAGTSHAEHRGVLGDSTGVRGGGTCMQPAGFDPCVVSHVASLPTPAGSSLCEALLAL